MEQEEKKETAPCCEQEEYHEDRVAAVKEDLPADWKVLYDLAELIQNVRRFHPGENPLCAV